MSDTIGEFYPIEGLVPHPKNPRHNDEAVSQIARSIERFGFTSPIIAREQDKTIIAGHTRWKAAKQIGLSKVPVVFVNLSVVDSELLMIADNKLGEKASWNYENLSELLDKLHSDEQDLSILGFDEYELKSFLFDSSAENDAFAEWCDMPEYNDDDEKSFRKIIVHFNSQEDVDNFAKLLGQSLTDKTRSIWYPAVEQKDHEGFRY